ncbi:MAG TPA: winged helix-turn-helix domain-containing protein [Phycisphaerae bacterium]|nr:winged helix-turn-helix domain-containing protein [Phycisphaerae bacterium]
MATKTKNRTKKTTKSKNAISPKKSASKKTATKKAKAALPKKEAAKSDKPKRVSAIDAAAQVLKKTGKAMRAQELIVAMAEQKLWTSPGGKTPHATLYAAILREINNKGEAARFTKVERGQFEFNDKAKG